MGDNTEKEKYDDEIIVSELSAPMQKWASMGFMRGLAGVRSEVLPKGKMTLPSGAFNELARTSLYDGDPSPEEIERRHTYIASVDQKLRDMQGGAINKHFKYAALGQLIDILVAIIIIGLIAGLIIRFGPFHPLVLAVGFVFAIKLLFLRHNARSVLSSAQDAFKAKTDTIKLPWSQ